MSFSVKALKAVNKLFPLPVHPFNTRADGGMTYAEWQYERGGDTIKFYLEYVDRDEMFLGKDVLDVGCGAAGKSLYYLGCGAKRVVGIDIVPAYKEESEAMAQKLGADGFEFRCEDASATSFEDNSFDTVIMNDAMEHVARPEEVLKEMYRILKPGGRLFVNFPPYNHPYGAHLTDAIGIPWVQAFFSDKALIGAYKDLVADKPDGEDRINFRIGKNDEGKEYFSYINKMSLKRFKKIKENSPFKIGYYNEVPLRSFLKPFCHGFLREYLIKMAVCVFEKQ